MGEWIRRPPNHRAGKRQTRVLCATGIFVLLFYIPAQAQRAPDFTLKDLTGQPHKLSGYFPEHVVLLDFWATWCVPCVKELPYLQKFQDIYGARGLQVLTISIDGPDRLASISGFIARYGYTLPVLLDTESQVVSVYNPRLNLPYSVLLDRQGTIRYAHQGYSPGDERLLEQRITVLLEEVEAKPKPKTSVQANESFLLRLPKGGSVAANPDSGNREFLNQLDLTASSGSFQAGARLDLNMDLTPLKAGLRLGKRYAQYSTTGFQGRAGDFYTSLGRGLIFSLVKVFEEEGLDYIIDTTVDGGEVSAAAGPISGGLFGGWIDRPEDRSVHDKVIGGNVGWTKSGLGAVRVQGVRAELKSGSEFGNHRVDQGSFGLELTDLGGVADIYGEFSLIRRTLYDAEAPLNGHGLYVGSKLRRGRFTLLLEMKDYRELNFEYARPPLLEAEELDILADQFDLDRTDITGYSAHIDYYAPASATLVYAKLLRVIDNPRDHPQYGSYDRKIGHVLAGVEKRFAGGGYLNGLAGWRRETATSAAFLRTAGETFHDQLNASWPLGRDWSLEADWKHKVFDGHGYDYYEIRSGLSLHRSPRWVLSALYERTTEPAIVILSGRQNWWAGQFEVRFGGGHSVRLFVGSTKGGMKCTGGVCRLFPPFEGVRLEAFLRF
jgi:peroxiredoxin